MKTAEEIQKWIKHKGIKDVYFVANGKFQYLDELLNDFIADHEAKLSIAVTALDKIANTLQWARKDADEKGEKLDGRVALQLSQDANFLKGIAEEALESLEIATQETANAIPFAVWLTGHDEEAVKQMYEDWKGEKP